MSIYLGPLGPICKQCDDTGWIGEPYVDSRPCPICNSKVVSEPKTTDTKAPEKKPEIGQLGNRKLRI